MKRFYLLTLPVLAVLLAVGCTKEVLVTTGELAAVKEVSAEAGSFPVAISTSGVWRVRPIDDWLHVDESLSSGDYAVMVNYDSNESTPGRRNFNRAGSVVVETYDRYTADTIRVLQRGLTPYMNLTDVVIEPLANSCTVPFDTNLTHAQRPTMKCKASASWVRSVTFGSDNMSLDVTLDINRGAERSCLIEVSFTDAWGEPMTKCCTLTQMSF